MKIGAITNSWGAQIHGPNLPDLVAKARDLGARHIELRQSFLGDFEKGHGNNWRPRIESFRSLAYSFPNLSFNLAIQMPFLSGQVDPHEATFQESLRAAVAVGHDSPHLRLVDLSPQAKLWKEIDDIPEESLAITELVKTSSSQGVTLSIENTRQSIGILTMLVNLCRRLLTEKEGSFLGLCPDPANQIRWLPQTDALSDLEAVPVDMLKIVHFKQLHCGDVIPTVDKGDLDCARMVEILKSKGYAGPTIFEIPSHDNVFDNLSRSFDYISQLSSSG